MYSAARNREWRRNQNHIKSQRLKNIVNNAAPWTVYWNDYPQGIYIQRASRNHYKRHLKKYSNKQLRHKSVYNNNNYKKTFDLWWILH